jgi:hypothetical protein
METSYAHIGQVPSLGLGKNASPAFLGFGVSTHTLARAAITARFPPTDSPHVQGESS